VLRQGSGVRPPLRALLLDASMVHHGGSARNQHKGTARVAIEPRGDACGRRAGIAWAWRRPRRARPRENDPGSDVVGFTVTADASEQGPGPARRGDAAAMPPDSICEF
jgi:hypothetical protein